MKLKHSGTSFDTIYCKQDGCIRIFNDIYTFKKHLNLKYSIVNKPSPIEDVYEVDMYENSLLEIDKKKDTFEKIDNTLSLTTTINLCRPDIDEFKTALTKSASAFVGKLCCNPNISKAAIQDIVQNTRELFNSDFLNILKQL